MNMIVDDKMFDLADVGNRDSDSNEINSYSTMKLIAMLQSVHMLKSRHNQKSKVIIISTRAAAREQRGRS